MSGDEARMTVMARRFGHLSGYWVPIVASLFPVMILAAENDAAEVPVGEVTVLALLSVLVTALAMGVARLLFRTRQRAVGAALIFVVAFFSFGYVVQATIGKTVGGYVVGRQLLLGPLIVLLSLILVFILVRYKGDLSRVFTFIGIFAVVLVTYNSARVINSWFVVPSVGSPGLPVESASFEYLPDVYFMIFDSYGREDVIRDMYGMDTSPFIQSLHDSGFYVADEARSNYLPTKNSIPSILTMAHLVDMTPEERSAVKAKRSHQNWFFEVSALGATASDLGYELHTFNARTPSQLFTSSLFTTAFLETTMLRNLTSGHIAHWLFRQFGDQWISRFNNEHRRMIDLVDEPSPTFAFSYNYPPHPPFVFTADGSLRSNISFSDPRSLVGDASAQFYADGWTEQVTYVNTLITNTVEQILSRSERPPIIVILSDHGPVTETIRLHGDLYAMPTDIINYETSSVLHAVHLPESCDNQFYPTATLVNTFRLIFNGCFQTEYEILSDDTYWGNAIKRGAEIPAADPEFAITQ